MFKKSLSFAVRHNNYFLYLEIKKIIRHIFASEFKDKDEKYIHDKIIENVGNIIKTIGKEKDIFNLLYNFTYVRDRKKNYANYYEIIKKKFSSIQATRYILFLVILRILKLQREKKATT